MLGGPLERSGFPPPSGDSDRRPVVYFCSAVLTRIVHHATVLTTVGDSYRLKTATRNQASARHRR